MINPAQYQQVLQKMPDQQLMQLLKRPDKIPSQFIIQEINRRKQMRQAEQARKQQVANAVAMQQQPVQTTTPEGQPAMGMQFGGRSGYRSYPMQSGIDFGIEYPDAFSPSFLNKADTPYYVSRQAKKQGKGFIPLYESSEQARQVPTRRGGVRSILPYQRGTGPYQVGDPNIASQGRPFGVTPEVTTPDGKTFTPVATSSEDPDDLGNFPEVVLDDSGIKSVNDQTTSENENLVNDAKQNVSKLPESNINNQFSTMLSELDTKLEKTKQPYNRDMLINGYKNSELFDTTATSFTELNDKSKARVEAFNARSDELRKAREKMIGDLEKEGRTKENIVFESLITTGLNLMASPNASFTQALGEAGKAGLATFQSLRKEEKDRVRQKHLMAYQLAEQEFAHKNQADQLESSLDLQKVNFNKTLQEMARQEKKDFIEESKLAKELEQKDDQLNIMADKNALEVTKTKINSLIAMDKLAVEKAGMNSLIQYRQDSTDLENKKLDSNVTVLSYMIQNKTDKETPDDIINKYIASQSNSTELGKAQQDLIKDIGKELAKKVDLERAVDDKQYAASILVTLQETLETFRDFSFGSGGESSIVDKINKLKN